MSDARAKVLQAMAHPDDPALRPFITQVTADRGVDLVHDLDGSVRATPTPPVTARGAEIHLNDWILASPATRACWGMDRIGGKWRVGLSVDGGDGRFERLPMAQHEDYAQCVINAIEIARLAGYA